MAAAYESKAQHHGRWHHTLHVSFDNYSNMAPLTSSSTDGREEKNHWQRELNFESWTVDPSCFLGLKSVWIGFQCSTSQQLWQQASSRCLCMPVVRMEKNERQEGECLLAVSSATQSASKLMKRFLDTSVIDSFKEFQVELSFPLSGFYSITWQIYLW